MRLRRFREHVKNEDWFAVGIDTLVVIVGIFVGLQVDAWNSARIENRLEQQYLDRLLADAESSIALQTANLDWLGIVIRGNAAALAALREGQAPEGGTVEFNRGIGFVGAVPPVRIDHTTIEELQGAGRMGLIDNVSLRRRLGDIMTLVRYTEVQVEFLRDRNMSILATVGEHWPVDTNAADFEAQGIAYVGEPLLEFEDVIGDNILHDAVARAFLDKVRLRFGFRMLLEETIALRDALRTELGLSVITENSENSQ